MKTNAALGSIYHFKSQNKCLSVDTVTMLTDLWLRHHCGKCGRDVSQGAARLIGSSFCHYVVVFAHVVKTDIKLVIDNTVSCPTLSNESHSKHIGAD